MSNGNDLVGKRLSFYQLFSENNLIVEIPTIQRDYAQGRQNKGEVRDLFLQALHDYLEENKPGRDLDFVYGSTEEVIDTVKFIPLDGQQRLTTLFLLHWYLAAKSNNSQNFKTLMLWNNKSRFTYLTRPSSSEFVDSLLMNEIDFTQLLETSKKVNNALSETIKNKGWYYLSWSYDPTIQSILNMLDAINNKFSEKDYFYERLVNLKTPVITFQYLNLRAFSLTEDLYIKMNSRGKPLTPFENFKAKLEQHISQLFGEKEKPFVISGKEINATFREYFSFQIDTTWANLFWQYKDLIGKPNAFDEELMNFIRVIIANQYAIENSEKLSEFKELIKNESPTAELTENISFHKFQSLGVLSKKSIIYLINSFDSLENYGKKIRNYLPDKNYFNEDEIFEKVLKYELSLPERALFHAYIRYLIINKIDNGHIYQWMRFVHNLVENSRIEEADQLINAIKSIEKLLLHCNDILDYLTNEKCNIEYFSSWQVEEEILKANLILKSEVWKKFIEENEKLEIHKGQICYLFEFSGVLKYFNKYRHCNWSEEEDKYYFTMITDYSSKSVALFSIYYTQDNDDYLLERTLLTKGNYLIPASNYRYNFGSSKSVSNYQRDYSWKRLLRYSTDEIEDWKSRRMCVKDLLDDSNFDTSNIRNALKIICKIAPDDWRAYFVNNMQLIDICEQGFIRIEGEEELEIELLYASQLNHYHCDMYIFNLYTKNFENLDVPVPFTKLELKPVKNSEEVSFIQFGGWTIEKKSYEMKIYRYDSKYEISFAKAKGDRSKDQFHQGIIAILENNSFKWRDEFEQFDFSRKSSKAITNMISILCSEFNEL